MSQSSDNRRERGGGAEPPRSPSRAARRTGRGQLADRGTRLQTAAAVLIPAYLVLGLSKLSSTTDSAFWGLENWRC